MPLQTTDLKDGIEQLCETLYGGGMTPAQARQQFAQQLSALIETFVKSGTVNVTVATTGTATAHTGTGTGTIS